MSASVTLMSLQHEPASRTARAAREDPRGAAALGELAVACQGGDRHAFDAIVRAAGPRLVRFLAKRMGDAHLAEDVAQDALVAALGAIARYDPARPFMPWLFQIAVRRGIDVRRARAAELRREREVGEGRPLEARPATADEGDAWAVARRTLSEKEHAALWMRYAEDFDIPEVATAIGKNQVATRVLLLRARRKLQGALAHLDTTKEARR